MTRGTDDNGTIGAKWSTVLMGHDVTVCTAALLPGTLVRDWRVRRRRSQMELALAAGVSPRHLSFVETGRSKASPELLLTLADHLDVPFRERNSLLLAGGYAPRYPRTSLDRAKWPTCGPRSRRFCNVMIRIRGSSSTVTGMWSWPIPAPSRSPRVSRRTS